MPEPSLDLTDDELTEMLAIIENAMTLAKIMSELAQSGRGSNPKLVDLLLETTEMSDRLSPRLIAVLERRRGVNNRLH